MCDPKPPTERHHRHEISRFHIIAAGLKYRTNVNVPRLIASLSRRVAFITRVVALPRMPAFPLSTYNNIMSDVTNLSIFDSN